MRFYDKFWQDIDQKDWPSQGEIFVCKDPQKRCWPDCWSVAIFWDPSTWKSEFTGNGWTTCPEIDIITRGLFWTKEDAILFAKALEIL
jgi:hypothetical protein